MTESPITPNRTIDLVCASFRNRVMASGASTEYIKVHHLIGQGNFVVIYSHTRMKGDEYALFDIFRLTDSKFVEHWDVQEKIGPRESWNNSGKF